MKNLAILILLTACLAIGCTNKKSPSHDEGDGHEGHDMIGQNEKSEAKPKSPHTNAMVMVGDAHIHIDYSSPRVRNRVIFGGLVSFDEVWVSGAHNATWLETNKDLIINGQTLPKGKYGFFTIPGKDEWVIIFNTNWNQHGADEYSQDDDVLRFKLTPENVNEIKEELTYSVIPSGDGSGSISLEWEKVKVSFDFEVGE